MEAAEYSEEGGWGGYKGDIDSVAPTTALAGDQVKEGGRAPTDCSRKGREQREKEKRGMEEDKDTEKEQETEKGVSKVQR